MVGGSHKKEIAPSESPGERPSLLASAVGVSSGVRAPEGLLEQTFVQRPERGRATGGL